MIKIISILSILILTGCQSLTVMQQATNACASGNLKKIEQVENGIIVRAECK